MIGLDTNVLLRCFVDIDDPAQAQRAQAQRVRAFVASRCTRDDPGHVDRVTLCEMIWVLARGYRYPKAEIARILDALLDRENLVLEDADCVAAALRIFRTSGVDFADALIGRVNQARGCETTATFDRGAAKLEGFVRVA